MNITSPVARPPSSLVGKAAFAIQTIVFVITLLLSVILLTDLQKVSVPGAPITYLYGCIAASVALAIAHVPWLFFRLPRHAKIGAYVAILPVLAMFGDYSNAMRAAYVRTPEGAKEAAEEARASREAAAVAAREAAEQKAKDRLAAQTEAEGKAAETEAQKTDLCDGLSKQVVDGEKILEINDITVEPNAAEGEALTCSGDAITSQGNKRVEFGVVQTPQGKALLSTRFP